MQSRLFRAPHQDRLSSSFVSVQMDFLPPNTRFFFFFLWPKYSDGTVGSHLKTRLSSCHNLCTQMLSLTKALMFWEKSRPAV